MIIVTDNRSMDQLAATLKTVSDNIIKEMGIATWETAKVSKAIIAKDVTNQIRVKQSDVKKVIKQKRNYTQAIVTLKKSSRFPLKRFSPRQTKAGVTYRISKSGKRELLPGGFMGPKPGVLAPKLHGHVWIRKGYLAPGASGPRMRGGARMREPIYIPRGPSPLGVVLKGERLKPITIEMKAELRKQVIDRIRYLRLKKAGAI